jgi:hypothetical protein
MVRDLSAERRSLLNESPTKLAARVERNRIWMDRYGGDSGLAALNLQSSQPNQSNGGKDTHEGEETKKSESVLQEEEEEEPYSPPALKREERHPNNNQQQPPVDAMYCGFCLITPCLFLQWQKDIERSEAHMDPEETNRLKRFNFYRRMRRELYGHLGKGVCKPLPHCFVQEARELYPNNKAEDVYTGLKRGPGGDGGGSSII